LNNGEHLDYASGLVIGAYRGLNTVDHGGADAGYRSDMIRFPDQHFSAACLCNLATANPSELNRKVAEIYLAKEMKPAESAHADEERGVQLKQEELKSRVGLYMNPDDDVIKVSVKNDKLHVGWGTGEESYELKALSASRFRLLIAPVDFTFDDAKSGDPVKLTLKSEDGKPDVFASVPAFTTSETELKNYAGVYSSPELDPLYEIRVEESKLVLHRLTHKLDTLEPVTRDFFVGSLGSIRFTRDSRSEVAGFALGTGRIRNLRFTKGRPAIPAQ